MITLLTRLGSVSVHQRPVLLQTNFHQHLARCDQFNEQKQAHALAVMSRYGQQVFQLLPVLLHYHHPLLPGFVPGDVPAGVCQFLPNARQQEFIDDLCQAANGHQGLESGRNEIFGIYCMGSTSSIGQSLDSDLDIWVCYSHTMAPERVAWLQQKCLLISQWAAQRQVELNLFLIPDNKFRTDNEQSVHGESCGSAQHLLLLDEFYRSHLVIAGKRLVWMFAPGGLGPDYDRFVAGKFADGTLNHQEWLDLGGFARIPAEEYFGSALWQLYKSIDSPYKAVLKTILMEAYSHEYPDTQLLCRDLKAHLQDADRLDERQDHYLLMLEKVTGYLKSIGDEKRLDLVRRCFYMKVSHGVDLSQARYAKRREQIKRLIEAWEWSTDTVALLNNRDHWKVEQVRLAYKELLEALMLSYRNLIQFAQRNRISESINPEDIGILSRKLYAAFENLPGKVQLINLGIAPDLYEPNISLIQVPEGRMHQAGWYLYKQGLSATELIGQRPLEHSRYASKLVAWAHFNGLVTADTELALFNRDTDLNLVHLQEFADDLARFFPVRAPAPSNLALSRPCEVRELAIFLNLEQDPTAQWRSRAVRFTTRTSDPFSFGQHRENLVGSIDILYRNSWDEIRTLHFSGETAILEALVAILGKMHQGATPPESVQVFCYSQNFRMLIRTRFQLLVKECIDLRLTRDQGSTVKTVRLGSEEHDIFFERRGVSVQKQETPEFMAEPDLLDETPDALQLDRQLDKPVPEIVDVYASEGLMQFFFENSGEDYNLYILDEANRVEVYRQVAGSKDELVQSINRFYASNQQAVGQSRFAHFNLPQYYEIVEHQGRQKVLPFKTNKEGLAPAGSVKP